VTQLVKDLQESARELLDENDWADEETKRLVAEKLEGMSVWPGFPEWVSNVSSVDRFYYKVRVADVDSGRSVCGCSIIIVFVLCVQRAFPAVSITYLLHGAESFLRS
jgi:hypothetical protein